MLTRRMFLTGASALTLSLYMPPAASAPPLDQEALEFVAKRIHAGLAWWDQGTRKELYRHAFRFAFNTQPDLASVTDFASMSDEHLTTTTDRLLRVSFRSLKMATTEDEYDFPIFRDGKLTVYGQNVVMGLPLAPSDWWPPELFDALSKLAPHYLA